MAELVPLHFNRGCDSSLLSACFRFHIRFVFVENQDKTTSQSLITLFSRRLGIELEKQHPAFRLCLERTGYRIALSVNPKFYISQSCRAYSKLRLFAFRFQTPAFARNALV